MERIRAVVRDGVVASPDPSRFGPPQPDGYCYGPNDGKPVVTLPDVQEIKPVGRDWLYERDVNELARKQAKEWEQR